MCWAHVQRAYARQLTHINDSKTEKSIDNDIHMLQLSSSEEIYHSGWILIREKYNKEIKSSKNVIVKI